MVLRCGGYRAETDPGEFLRVWAFSLNFLGQLRDHLIHGQTPSRLGWWRHVSEERGRAWLVSAYLQFLPLLSLKFKHTVIHSGAARGSVASCAIPGSVSTGL